MNKKDRIFILFAILFAFCLFLCSCEKGRDSKSSSSTASRNPKMENYSHSQGLERFLNAQTSKILQDVEKELKAGNKTTHWIWFIFPQLKDLGSSSTAIFYGITSLNEAKAYLEHDVLGKRLVEHTSLVLSHKNEKSLKDILNSSVDVQKFKSSMTLFIIAAYENQSKKVGKLFADNLRAFNNNGAPDEKSLNILGVSNDKFKLIMQWAES
jgi:uncharacterized protein (DUF1810 family)